jgi:hypothetical protein
MLKMRDIPVPRITALGFILIASAQFGFLYGSALLIISGGFANVAIGAVMWTLASTVLTILTRLFLLDRRILKMSRTRHGA